MWRFRSNGQYFGVTQYLDAFTPEEVMKAEEIIDVVIYKEIKALGIADRYKIFYGKALLVGIIPHRRKPIVECMIRRVCCL